ncbi:MAG: non-homologous end-joining DNA ligase [Phycisphaeraceae bacterium]
MQAHTVQFGKRRLRLGNLEKVMYHRAGFTKAQLIAYYARIAPTMLPHLRGRPVTLRRFPDGVEGPWFYQKNCPVHRPAWLPVASIASESQDDGRITYCQLDEAAAMVWAANLAAIELHASLHHSDTPNSPTAMVFDLDPTAPAGFGQCVQAAFELKAMLAKLDMRGHPKHSGGKGLHVYVPMRQPSDYDYTKGLAQSMARVLAQHHRRWVTDRMSKAGRGGKVFVDWSQNTRSKTTVCVYSLRAEPVPRVSAPMTWEELTPWMDDPGRPGPGFGPDEVIERVEAQGDLFAALTAGA